MSQSALRSTFLHLRLPFSFFLLPIFLFGLLEGSGFDAGRTWAAFFIIHFLLYPASHAFNTWYDRDEQAIGLLSAPPPVHASLAWAAWILDALALGCAWFVGGFFFAALVVYTLGSKLYSWKVTRLKKRPVAGWLGVGLVQGSVTFLAVVQGLGEPRAWSDPVLWLGTATAALFLWGVYPMTQVYQHEEDERHGDLTISRLVGIRGTFVLSALFMGAAVACFVFLFVSQKGWLAALAFLGFQAATLVYFLWWAFGVWKDASRADFRRTMGLNLLASGTMSAYFLMFLLEFRP
jgi:1,4-dihydroxy-2-naphthoate octaprenyltransferase